MNAIGVSAGVDLDLTLEDLRRILDSYKHTSPIIKIGITKEVQSIGMSLPSIASSPSPSLPSPSSLSLPLSLPSVFSFRFGLVCSLCNRADRIKIVLRETAICYRDPPFSSFLPFSFPFSLLVSSLFFFFLTSLSSIGIPADLVTTPDLFVNVLLSVCLSSIFSSTLMNLFIASAATLFRGDSTAPKLMTTLTRLTGHPYLVATMQPLLEHIFSDPAGYEV